MMYIRRQFSYNNVLTSIEKDNRKKKQASLHCQNYFVSVSVSVRDSGSVIILHAHVDLQFHYFIAHLIFNGFLDICIHTHSHTMYQCVTMQTFVSPLIRLEPQLMAYCLTCINYKVIVVNTY